MRVNNLFSRRKRKFKITTNSKHNYPIASNSLNQDFKVFGDNQVLVSEITYMQTKQGWMFLTVIIDLFSRKVVGWSMSDNVTTQDTIIAAWHMAIKSNVITEQFIFNSDRASPYASYKFTNSLKSDNGLVKQSRSRKGTCWDNTEAKSFFNSLKVERVYKHNYSLKSEAELSVFQ